MPHALLALFVATPAYADVPAPLGDSAEDEVSAEQSVDGYTELEDAQVGQSGKLEQRLWLSWGYVPSEGYTPSETLELSYTGKGVLRNTELDLAQNFEHSADDSALGFEFGWMQRWVKDGGRTSLIPSVGTLTEYYLRTPGLGALPAFAAGAADGDHVAEILTIAKYLGPGTLYLNGEAQLQLFGTHPCVTGLGGGDLTAPDGCDAGADYSLAARVGYKLPVLEDKLELEFDFTHETPQRLPQPASATLAEAETPATAEMGNVAAIWHIDEHWAVSPGVRFGLDGREDTPTYEAGVFLLHE